ncbi:MAG: TetR/AcrR family transcriptional regulator [Microthrixaceae bacterium]
MSATASDIPTLDGRRARRERGRAAVVDAVFALLQQHGTQPTVEAIAEQAGVSVSSVFRYFEGLDDLREHTIERYFQRYSHRFEVPALGQGPLPNRIAGLVGARLDLYEAIAPMARIARLRALETPRFATTVAATRTQSAEQVRAHFAPELAKRTPARADDLAALIDSMTSIESWELLSDTHDRSRQQIRRAWVDGIGALLA